MDKKIFFTVEYPGAETKKKPRSLCERKRNIPAFFKNRTIPKKY